MEDSAIIDLFLSRSENALRETQSKYDSYLYKIAFNILGSHEDSSECVNDTYYKAWESIPPNRPKKLSAYLGTIVRNTAITLFRQHNTASRADSQYALSLEELGDCVSDVNRTDESADLDFLSKCISDYLRTLPSESRNIFMCRYYFNDSISDIASAFGATEAKIKSSLFRTRNGLKQHLTNQGYDL